MEQQKLQISDLYHTVANNVTEKTYNEIMDCVVSEYDSTNVTLQDLVKNTVYAPPGPNMKPDRITLNDKTIVHEWFDEDGLLHREYDQPARVEYLLYEGYGHLTKMLWMKHGEKHRDYDMPAEVEYEPEGPLIGMKWWNYGNLAREVGRPVVIKYCDCGKPDIEYYVKEQEVHECIYTDLLLDNRPDDLPSEYDSCGHVLLQKTVYSLVDGTKLQDMFFSDWLIGHDRDMTMYHYVLSGSGNVVVACVEKYEDGELVDQQKQCTPDQQELNKLRRNNCIEYW